VPSALVQLKTDKVLRSNEALAQAVIHLDPVLDRSIMEDGVKVVRFVK
jgi:hypothetical protein